MTLTRRLARAIEVSGTTQGIGATFDGLRSQVKLDGAVYSVDAVYCDASGGIQLRDTFTVEVRYTYYFTIFSPSFAPPVRIPINMSAKLGGIHISAWEDMAKELCKYKKGDMLHIVANARPGTYKISEEKTISVTEATVRAFLSENQAQDLKRGVFDMLRAMDGVCMDLLTQNEEDIIL